MDRCTLECVPEHSQKSECFGSSRWSVGACGLLGFVASARDVGYTLDMRLWSHSCAAIVILQRHGCGRVRRVETPTLSVHPAIKDKKFVLNRVPETSNMLGICAKDVDCIMMTLTGIKPRATDMYQHCCHSCDEGRLRQPSVLHIAHHLRLLELLVNHAWMMEGVTNGSAGSWLGRGLRWPAACRNQVDCRISTDWFPSPRRCEFHIDDRWKVSRGVPRLHAGSETSRLRKSCTDSESHGRLQP